MGKLNVDGTEIQVLQIEEDDYISLTDMVRKIDNGPALIEKWLRNKNTIEFLGIWEEMYNADFNAAAYEEIMLETGLNRFIMSVKQWVSRTNSSLSNQPLPQSQMNKSYNTASERIETSLCALFYCKGTENIAETKDILLACVDRLSDFPQAIEAFIHRQRSNGTSSSKSLIPQYLCQPAENAVPGNDGHNEEMILFILWNPLLFLPDRP